MSSPQKISQLTTAGPLTGAELVPVVQNSGTLQTTVADFVALANVSLLPVVSALQTQIDQVSAVAASNSTAITSVQADVSTLTVRVASVSALASTNAAAITSVSEVVSALEVRVSSVSAAAVSLEGAITSINAVVSALDVRVAAVSASVSVLNVQMQAVQASISAINSALAAIDVSAITALEVRVSTLELEMIQVEASISAINSVLATIDTSAIAGLEVRVSALEIRVTDVSALTSVNAAAITSVNAVLSTKVNRVGDYMDSVQYIEFDTSTSIAISVGRLNWDLEYGTLDVGLAGGNSSVLVGQREVMYVYNNTAGTLTKGAVVEVTGAQGQRLTVKLAQADNDANSATVLGVMLETVSVNGSGYVATNGIVRNVDTGAFTDGQIVYLSPTSAGELTATKPIAPQHLVLIGYIVKGGSVGAGSIYVKTQNGYEIGELHDVKTSSSTSISNNEVLAYNTSAGVWTNSTVLLDVQASVSALNVQVAAVSALTSVNAANIAAVSALVSALDIRVAAVSASVSALQVQVNNVSAALTSTNNVVSALEIRVSSASATGATNTAAITSINNVVSALEIRVSTVSAQAASTQTQVNAVSVLVSALDVRVAAVSASVSALQVQVNAVSAAVSAAFVSVGQRVLKAGDTMSGELDMTDNLVTRPKFKDYALVAVLKGNVSTTTTLDLVEGNYFQVTAAGSTTFVFANPPVSAANGGAAGGFVLELTNGGAATVTWPSATKWPGGTAPTLTASGTDVLVFVTDDGGTIWRGLQSMKDSK